MMICCPARSSLQENGGSFDDIGLTHGVMMEREMVRGSLAGRDAASGAATPYKWQLSHQSRPAT
jgi:hypothetical protein